MPLNSFRPLKPVHVDRFFDTARVVRDGRESVCEELQRVTMLYRTRSIMLPHPEVTKIAQDFPQDVLRIALACMAASSSQTSGIMFQKVREMQTIDENLYPFPTTPTRKIILMLRKGQPLLRDLRAAYPVAWRGLNGTDGASMFMCQWMLHLPYEQPPGDAAFSCVTYVEERYGLAWLTGDMSGPWTRRGNEHHAAQVVEKMLALQHESPYRKYQDDGFVWSAFHITAFAAAFGHHSLKLLLNGNSSA
jgi:hypothetical protein